MVKNKPVHVGGFATIRPVDLGAVRAGLLPDGGQCGPVKVRVID